MPRKDEMKIRVNTKLQKELEILVMGAGLTPNGLGNYLLALGIVDYLQEPGVGFHGPSALFNAKQYVMDLRQKMDHTRFLGVNAPKKVEAPAPIVEKPLVEAKLDGESPPPQ